MDFINPSTWVSARINPLLDCATQGSTPTSFSVILNASLRKLSPAKRPVECEWKVGMNLCSFARLAVHQFLPRRGHLLARAPSLIGGEAKRNSLVPEQKQRETLWVDKGSSWKVYPLSPRSGRTHASVGRLGRPAT